MIHLILLAYNEAAALPRLLEHLNEVLGRQNEPFRFLVVDDGSRDKTAEAAETLSTRLPMVLLRHPANQGVAQAFNTGIRRAAGDAKPEDIVITMEGDLTNDPGCIPAMLDKLKQGFDVVCASRYQPGGGYRGFPRRRHLLSLGANILARLFFRLPGVADYTLFFKGYRARVLQQAISDHGHRFIECRGFASNAEILVKACRASSARCAEVPTVYRYDLKAGKSKMAVGKNLLEYLKLFWRAP